VNAAAADEPVFVGEGAPIPIPQSALGANVLGPAKKLATIRTLTDSLLQHSIPSAELVISTILREATARALDKAIFSNVAASAIRPAGILNGVAPIAATGTTGNPGNMELATADFAKLVDAITDAYGGEDVMLFVSPGRAVQLTMAAPGLAMLRELGGRLVAMPTIANATIIAVNVRGFASSFGPDPEITVSDQATVHMEDTAPADIGTVGTPNIVAAPTISLFQSQSTAIRLILRCAWSMRAPGLVQWMQNVNW
jgi:hypothetical protein